MGITIHYSAVIPKKEIVERNTNFWLEEIPRIAKTVPKPFEFEVFKINPHSTWVRDLTHEDMFNSIYAEGYIRDEEMIPGKHQKTTECEGVLINVHPGCESISFIPCKTPEGWVLESFTKTQYCGVPGHLVVCRILEEAKKRFFKNMRISDEAEYCGKKDKNMDVLRESMEENAIMIDQIGAMLEKQFGKDLIVKGGEMAARKHLKETI
jgi:hypothetical protein